MNDRVLVTGATGFIGHHLVSALIDRGSQVRCLVRPTSNLDHLPRAKVELTHGDVLDPSSLPAAATGVDRVFHLAGEIDASARKRLYRVNVEGTHNLAAACAALADPPTLVLVSSQEAGGPDPDTRPRTERDPAAPVTDYGRSKLQGERAAAAFAERVPITVVRTPAVFGEYDTQSLAIFKAFRLGGLGIHVLPRAGRTRLSLVHARDLSDFLILAADRGERLDPGRPETDGSGLYYPAQGDLTLRESIQIAAEAIGEAKVTFLNVPLGIVYLLFGLVEAWSRLGGARAGVMTLDKARAASASSWTCDPGKSRELGFQPAHSLPERLRQTARWYRENGWLS